MVLNAVYQGKRLKTQNIHKDWKEKAMRMTYSPLKPGYERKERNMIVARRGSRFKLGSFQGGREAHMFKGKRKAITEWEKVNLTGKKKDFYLYTLWYRER